MKLTQAQAYETLLCVYFYLRVIGVHQHFEVLVNTCTTRLPTILTSFLVTCNKHFAWRIGKRQDRHSRQQSTAVPSSLALRSQVPSIDGSILTYYRTRTSSSSSSGGCLLHCSIAPYCDAPPPISPACSE
jgi:hypothetical protein